MAYLDDTGLAYFWGKIKSYVANLLGLKADDSAVVHIAGAETITGAKTFSSDITVNQSSIKATVKDTNSSTTRTEEVFKANSSNSSYGINTMFGSSSSVVIGAGEGKNSQLTELDGVYSEFVYLVADANIYLKSNANTYANAKILKYNTSGNIVYENPNATRGTNPSSAVERGIVWTDSADNRFGLISNIYRTDGSSETDLYAYKTIAATGGNIGRLGIGSDSSGNIYTIAPTPAASSNDTNIATTAWVKNYGAPKADAVLSSSLKIKCSPYIFNGNFTKGTSDGTAYWTIIDFHDNETSDNRMGWIGHVYYGNKASVMKMQASKANAAGDTDTAEITVNYYADGTSYATAPTPATTANGIHIATTAWVRTYCEVTKGFLTSHQSLSNYVTLNTDQTITGHKTHKYWIATNASYYLTSTSLVRRTIPSGVTSQYIIFEDKNGVDLSNITFSIDGSGQNILYFALYDFGKTTTSVAFAAGCSCDYNAGSSGTPYNFRPFSDNNVALGASSRRWKQLYAGTTTISTSDERLKQNIETVPDNVLDVWEDVSFCQFKMRDAVEEKGNKARLHNGLIAQQIEGIFSSKGLNASDYGLFCYDSWKHKDASIDEKGYVVEEELLAGDKYSLRYEEALCMEAAYQRRENARLKKRVADLEERLAALELRLGSE